SSTASSSRLLSTTSSSAQEGGARVASTRTVNNPSDDSFRVNCSIVGYLSLRRDMGHTAAGAGRGLVLVDRHSDIQLHGDRLESAVTAIARLPNFALDDAFVLQERAEDLGDPGIGGDRRAEQLHLLGPL